MTDTNATIAVTEFDPADLPASTAGSRGGRFVDLLATSEVGKTYATAETFDDEKAVKSFRTSLASAANKSGHGCRTWHLTDGRIAYQITAEKSSRGRKPGSVNGGADGATSGGDGAGSPASGPAPAAKAPAAKKAPAKK